MLWLSGISRSCLSFCRTIAPSVPVIRQISTTAVMCAEPLKKKKKLDVQIMKMRHDRKIRKVEKAIKQLKKTPRQLKPIEEYKLPPAILRDIEQRTRPLTEEDKQTMQVLDKLNRVWIAYKSQERLQEQQNIRQVASAQQQVLRVLQSENQRLYEAAVAIDADLLPFEDNHMITETAPNPEYTPPDGAKVDISKVWYM